MIRVTLAIALAIAAGPLLQGDAQKRADQLIRSLASSNALERERAAIELATWGDDYGKHVEAAMKSGDADFQARCADILKQIDVAQRGRRSWAPTRPANVPQTSSTLKDATERLTKIFGTPIGLAEVDPKVRVSFKMDYGTFLQALEAMCRSCGLWYRWRDTGVEMVKEKPPELPRIHLGPFALAARITTLEDEPGLFLHVDTDWDRKVAPEWFEVKIDSMTDDKGGAVLQARRKENGDLGEATVTKKFSVRRLEEYRHEWTQDDFLLGPVPKGTLKLSSVKGQVTFWFPLEFAHVRFEDPKPGATAEAGPFTAALNFYDYYKDRKSWELQMELKLGDTPRETAIPLHAMLVTRSVRFIDAAGKSYDSGTKGGYGKGGTAANRFQRIHIDRKTDQLPLDNPPKVVECEVVTGVWTRTFAFEIKDVRMPKEKK